MRNQLKTKDGKLEVKLYDSPNLVEIELRENRNVSIEISSGITTPPGALFAVKVYESAKEGKLLHPEYDEAYLMEDGKIIRKKEYNDYMVKLKHPEKDYQKKKT